MDMGLKYLASGLFLSLLLLVGCSKSIPVAQLKKSAWYQSQLKIVTEKGGNILIDRQELWYGKVSRINSGVIEVEQAKCMASQGQKSGGNSVSLWFEKGKLPNDIAAGDWIAARVERSLKDQCFVRDYRLLTQIGAVPREFAGDYERILLVAIEHGWHLKVEIPDDRQILQISHGLPRKTVFYAAVGGGNYSGERCVVDEFFSGDDFDFTVYDVKLVENACTLDIARKFSAPGMVVAWNNDGRKRSVFRCGYNFNPATFAAITGRNMDEYGPARIRFPVFLESAGTIAAHPATLARRNELQKAFDEAGIDGEWRVGDRGRMIFFGKCREYELDLPWLNQNAPVTIEGPVGDGFIFSLSPPREAPAAIALFNHGGNCKCREFYYWNITSGMLSWKQGQDQIYHDWDFEFGHALPEHEKVLYRILQVFGK